MNNIVETIRRKPMLYETGSVSIEDAKNAELCLAVSFAEDYYEYILTFGAISYLGHELTGICDAKRLNVVDVTNEERKRNDVPSDWYVVEETNIDGIVVWQDGEGVIYTTAPNSKAHKLCNSLAEYISL